MNKENDPMTKPTIHLNGTSAADLAAGYERAAEAIFHALESMASSSPNARDYYPQGPDAYERARREHDTRCRKLHEVQTEINALHEHVVNEEEARRRART